MTNTELILSLYDGVKTSVEIAKIVGLSPRYVRKVATKYDLERLGPGARKGDGNHQFVSGRRVDTSGYVLVSAPQDHPFARTRKDRKTGIIREHRLVMEQTLGRYLLPGEVVDHRDGLTLHNSPSNLRLFETNGDHLHATVSGCPQWSLAGKEKLVGPRLSDRPLVDIYSRRKERGDVRLRQILLAALSLGIDSPYLLGTHLHLKKAGIYPFSRSNLERGLDDLMKRWEADLLQ